ncbi:hypothetical protein ACFWWT_38325 [Streptomyces sp. NPDC058676]|uniref:hypothetical protein n=1 Tax=unclassified Streptomyces TaxID=2593676 RepID=UPI003649418E
MEVIVTVVVILAMTAVGVYLIRRLNAQHDERIAAFHYGSPRPALRVPVPTRPWKTRRVRKGQQEADAPDGS